FPDNSFDLTFCHALLHHIDTGERLQVIREMTRVSKKHVVIIEPNRNNPFMAAFGLLKKEEWGLLRFSLRYLRDLAEKEGLRILFASSYGILTPNRMPIPAAMLSPIVTMEPFVPLGVTNIVIGQKT
ncbi:MAG: methyltransferase domain-containing protein, partial [Patescibacteria group bacterium]